MPYTVHELANLADVTIKALYHYQKIGLLNPEAIAANGYRYYGESELKRLQQILFYRELDFPLAKIKVVLDRAENRLACLKEQHVMLKARQRRLLTIIGTLEETMRHEREGSLMEDEKKFKGFSKAEWAGALLEQNRHLQGTYGYRIDTDAINADEMNEKAQEAAGFMAFMAEALRDGRPAGDQSILDAIEKHLHFLKMKADGFVAQAKFLASDDFHRRMLEDQQVGLSYFICFAAENYEKAMAADLSK